MIGTPNYTAGLFYQPNAFSFPQQQEATRTEEPAKTEETVSPLFKTNKLPPWASIGLSTIHGISAGRAAYISRKEDRFYREKQNEIYRKVADKMYSAGLSASNRDYQSAGGAMAYMQYKNKGNDGVIQQLSGLISQRINNAQQSRLQSSQLAGQYLGQQIAPQTMKKYDKEVGFLTGINTGIGSLLSLYNL